MAKQKNPLLDDITVPAKSKKARAVPDAATGKTFAYVRESDVDDLNKAVKRARKAQVAWAELSHAQRSAILNKAADEVEAHAEELARIIAQETGQPVERVREDIDHDYWMNVEEAKDYGILGTVVRSMKEVRI